MQTASKYPLQAGNAHNGGITMSASTRDLVGIIINRTSRTWRTKLDERLSHLGLTQARWLVLMHLSRMNGKALQKDLAVSVGVEGPTLVRVLDGLERMGLVERVGVEGDRRACHPPRPHAPQGPCVQGHPVPAPGWGLPRPQKRPDPFAGPCRSSATGA